jgi:CubicO group peptidase (beta-lactamase class C family)
MAFKKFLAFLTILSSVYFPIGAQTGIEIPEMSVCDDMVIDFLEEYNIPGASFALTKDGKLVYHRAFGHADISGNEITQPYHLFRIASLSKPITSISIMKMIEDGQISLSDKVFGVGGLLEYHPEIANATISDSRIYNITVQNLLEHSAGWNRDIDCFPNPTFPYSRSFSGCDPFVAPLHVTATNGTANPASEEDLIVFLLEKGLDFAPNTSYAYSNIGYLVLGEIIEEVSNLTYEDYVKREILSPLGICDMHLGKNLISDKQQREVEYIGNGGTTLSCYGTGVSVPWEYGGFNLEAMDAHGGWIASSRDLVRLLVAVDGFVSKPDILQPSTIATMTTPSANNSRYAKGWAVNSANNWWHTGSLDGTATIFVRTSGGYTWAVLLNKREVGSTDFFADLDNLPWNCVNSVSTFPNHDLFDRPATGASDITFSSITTNSVKLSWTNGTGDKRIVVATENPSISSFPLDGEGYFYSNSFSQGDDLGNNTYVVSDDDGSSTEVFNLEPNTQYTFAVYEYNQSTNTGNHKLYKLCGSAEATVSTNKLTNFDVIWTGGTGDWNVASNWDSNVVPDQNSDVHIPPSENDTVFIPTNVAVKARTIEIGAGSILYLENASSSITIDDGLMDNDGIIINKGVINISRQTYTLDNKNFYGISRGYVAFANWGIIENYHELNIVFSVRGHYLNERGSIFKNHESGTFSSDHIINLGGQFTNSGKIQGSIGNQGYGDYGHDDPAEDSTYIGNFLNKGIIMGESLSSSEFSEYYNFGRIELDSSTTNALWVDDQAYFVNYGSITLGPTIGENALEIYRPSGGFRNAPGSRLEIMGASNHGIHITTSSYDTLLFNDKGAEIVLAGIDGAGIYITGEGNLDDRKVLNKGKITFGSGTAQNAIVSEGETKLTNLDSGEIYGTGVIDGAAFSNQGSLLPGLSPGIGTFEITDNYDHTQAIYEVELAGTDGPGIPNGHDQLNISGTTTLGGTLNLTLIDDFSPSIGDSFIIMNCTSGCQGEFETINLPLDPLSWEILYEENSVTVSYIDKSTEPQHYEVLDIDYCIPREAPYYNFYWTEMKSVERGAEFFSQNETHTLTFTEYADGTALIQGTTQSGTCSAELYIVLKDRKSWARWSADGGGFKPHGCDTASLVKEGLRYYVIDGNQSIISVTGGDCLEGGTFMVTQRPDPDDPSTDNLGVHIGPGGALFDSDPTAEGLAGWAWMGPEGDERRWKIDFNFHIERSENLAHENKEVCDGIDNNGDGQIDEGLICDQEPSVGVTQTVITPYPTRFNDRLNLQIEIEYSATAQVQLFDLQWRSVMVKKDLNILPGRNDLSLDVAGLAPNMYILVLNTGREEFKLKVFAK